ncbi:LysR family transcriptional regulator [Kitasatospora sp. NPDC093806]|uniref:LysR family transcriptional regulator n=1 Tax=Kitasatospora sp. NPDC093806 TaxID=3155075 RepID=UPI00343BE8CD
MQLGWLQTFIAVYRTGSFTKAARELGITQPAVTQQIRGLEVALGGPLFHRTPKGALPTVEGEALAHDVRDPLAELDIAVRRHFGGSPSSRPLRLGGPAELIAARVLPSLGGLIARGLDVRVSLGEAAGLLESLRAGHLDLVVSTVPARSRGVDAVPLTDEEFALVASPGIADGLLRDGLALRRPEALEKVPLIAYAETLPIIRRYWQTVFSAPPPGSPAVVVPDLRAVIAAVAASAGVSVVPTYLCERELDAGTLVQLLRPDLPPINTFYLATRSGTLADARLADLHAHLLTESRTWT